MKYKLKNKVIKKDLGKYVKRTPDKYICPNCLHTTSSDVYYSCATCVCGAQLQLSKIMNL